MLEALVVASATTGLVAIARGLKGNQRFETDRRLTIRLHEDGEEDLPCPWCYAPTAESDNRCSGCGRNFG